jgi:chemotaxis protein MotB
VNRQGKIILWSAGAEHITGHLRQDVLGRLRVKLTESAAGTFFDSGSDRMSADGSDLVRLLAQELGKLPNHIAIEGHTDSKPYPPGASYTNWELSADRANAARRLMQNNGIREDQITQVRGFADQRLRKPEAPLDPSNRRSSLIVQYMEKPSEGASSSSGEHGSKAGAKTPEGKQARSKAENAAKSAAGEAARAGRQNTPEKE